METLTAQQLTSMVAARELGTISKANFNGGHGAASIPRKGAAALAALLAADIELYNYAKRVFDETRNSLVWVNDMDRPGFQQVLTTVYSQCAQCT